MKSKKYTNIKQVTFRAVLVLLFLIFLIIILATSSVYAGIKTGEFNNRIIKPIREKVTSISEFLETEPATSEIKEPTQESDVQPTEQPSPTVIIIYRNGSTNNTYTRPTYPTPKPGDPGSKEWYENNRKFEQEVKNSMDQFCKDNPNLPPCK